MIRKYKGKEIRIIGTGIDSSGTSTGSDVKLTSVLVPAGTITVDDVITIRSFLRATTTYGGHTVTLWWNTSDSLTGALGLAKYETSGNAAPSIYRRILFTELDSAIMFNTGTASSTDLGESTAAYSTVAIDTEVDGYFMISSRATTSGRTNDTMVCSFLTIRI